MDDELDLGTQAWIEQVCAAPLLGVRRLERWRPTWWIEVGREAPGRQLVLKNARAPQHVTERSEMLRRFGIDREAAVLQVLSAHGMRVPRFVGHRQEAQQLLIGAMPGVAELQAIPDLTLRSTAMADYGAALAAVHTVDWLQEGLGALADDPAGPAHLPGPLAAVVADSTRWAAPPDPLLALALDWMREHRPAALGSVLLHGDAGANQFLVDSSGLSAMLDWELAYIGDPMSDLAYARYREALYPSGAYPALVEGWAHTSGLAVDVEVLNWYTVAACLVMLIGIARDARRPRAANAEAVQRLWWDAVSRVALCQVLAEDAGGPPVVPDNGVDDSGAADTAMTHIADLLMQRLGLTGDTDGSSSRGLRERRHTLALAATLLRSSRAPLAPLASDADLAAMTRDAIARMSLAAPLAVSDSWGELGADDAQEWQTRLSRPVLPDVPAAKAATAAVKASFS